MCYLFNGVSLQNGRQSNMDSLLLKSKSMGKRRALLAVVCDGVGSMADGAFTSGIAIQMLSEWFSKKASIHCAGLKMRDVVLEINAYVVSEARQKKLRTASTLSALLLIERNYYITHVGDSRIYSYKNGALSILTPDDVSQAGKLTACIGQKENIFLHYTEGAVADQTFLICSDGLYKRMDAAFMAAKLKAWNRRLIDDPIKTLPQYVIERGEQDNISLALVKIENRGTY